jgi:hypothetical protein
MEEPTHSRESLFWDQVADWLLCVHDPEHNVLEWEEIAGIARARSQPGEQARPTH